MVHNSLCSWDPSPAKGREMVGIETLLAIKHPEPIYLD